MYMLFLPTINPLLYLVKHDLVDDKETTIKKEMTSLTFDRKSRHTFLLIIVSCHSIL